MTSNESLSEIIARKEQQLTAPETEINAWNRGKYKGASNASLSQIYVESLKKSWQISMQGNRILPDRF